MYQILVSSKYSSGAGGASIHTLVIVFNTKAEADRAADIINGQCPRGIDYQTALRL